MRRGLSGHHAARRPEGTVLELPRMMQACGATRTLLSVSPFSDTGEARQEVPCALNPPGTPQLTRGNRALP